MTSKMVALSLAGAAVVQLRALVGSAKDGIAAATIATLAQIKGDA